MVYIMGREVSKMLSLFVDVYKAPTRLHTK